MRYRRALRLAQRRQDQCAIERFTTLIVALDRKVTSRRAGASPIDEALTALAQPEALNLTQAAREELGGFVPPSPEDTQVPGGVETKERRGCH
jgi:hypothetical protein